MKILLLLLVFLNVLPLFSYGNIKELEDKKISCPDNVAIKKIKELFEDNEDVGQGFHFYDIFCSYELNGSLIVAFKKQQHDFVLVLGAKNQKQGYDFETPSFYIRA